MGLNLDRLPGAYAEDSQHTDGDRGSFILAVANHVEGALHDADGDYAALQVDSLGRLRTVADLDISSEVPDNDTDSENPLKVGSRARFGNPLPAISTSGDKADLISDEYRRIYTHNSAAVNIANGAQSVDNVLETIMNSTGSNLTGRIEVMVQNRGGKSIFVGATGVSAANGIEIDKKSTLNLKLGDRIDLYAIGTSAVVDDVRVLEIA